MLIWPILVKFRRNIPRIMKNKSVSGNFYFQNIFPVVSNYASHLACFKLLQLQMWISRQPIKISEKPDTLKGEVWSRKILPLLVELFHRNSKLISSFPVCFAITTTALSSCSYLPLSRPEKRHLGYDVSYDVAIVKPCCSSLWPGWLDWPFWRVFLMRV